MPLTLALGRRSGGHYLSTYSTTDNVDERERLQNHGAPSWLGHGILLSVMETDENHTNFSLLFSLFSTVLGLPYAPLSFFPFFVVEQARW